MPSNWQSTICPVRAGGAVGNQQVPPSSSSSLWTHDTHDAPRWRHYLKQPPPHHTTLLTTRRETKYGEARMPPPPPPLHDMCLCRTCSACSPPSLGTLLDSWPYHLRILGPPVSRECTALSGVGISRLGASKPLTHCCWVKPCSCIQHAHQ